MSEVRQKLRDAAVYPVLPPSSNRFSVTESGYTFAEIDVVQPVGHTVQDALRPEYWVNHARKLAARPVTGEPDRAGALIRLRTDDHLHFATLYVRAVNDNTLIVQQLGETFFLGQKAVEFTGYEIRWNVGNRGYDVIRNSDRSVVASKIKTREEAQDWVSQITKAA